MKRHKQMWDKVASLENLMEAMQETMRGKRGKQAGAFFFQHWETEMVRLERELAEVSYRLGAYHYFKIYEPKVRVVRTWPAGGDLFDEVERRKGLPIGNLTSQFFANIYLDGFDHFAKQELRVNVRSSNATCVCQVWHGKLGGSLVRQGGSGLGAGVLRAVLGATRAVR